MSKGAKKLQKARHGRRIRGIESDWQIFCMLNVDGSGIDGVLENRLRKKPWKDAFPLQIVYAGFLHWMEL